jgi:predicted amidohydrolase
MKKLLMLLIWSVISISLCAQFTPDLPKVKFIDYQPENRQWFVRFGQFQLNFDFERNPANGLVLVVNPAAYVEKLTRCLDIAKKNKLNVIIFPEVSMSLPDDLFGKMLTRLQEYSKENDAIIIAGTFYDAVRRCKNITVLPTGVQYSYKTRPSIVEASSVANEGMLTTDSLHVFRTKYGNLLTLVCVDLISDDANYVARSLSNRGMIDMLININYNPKSQEFMREASAMTVRHPLFVSLINVSLFQGSCTQDGDEYGNTSVFGSINSDYFKQKLLKNIPDCYKTIDKKALQPAYRQLLGIVSPEIEGVLVYDLNLRVIRTPWENNAPDQGYPTIRNLEVIRFDW